MAETTIDRLTAVWAAYSAGDGGRVGELGMELLIECEKSTQYFLIVLSMMMDCAEVAIGYTPGTGRMQAIVRQANGKKIKVSGSSVAELLPAIFKTLKRSLQ